MARTHTFKGSTAIGYAAFIEDGKLLITEDWGNWGGILYRGDYNQATNILSRLKREAPVLYDDIEKYFIKHGVSDESDRKDLGGDEAKTITYRVRLIMNNGKEIVAIISGTSETEVIRKIMPPVPDTVLLHDLEGRTMAVRSDKIYTVAILD